MKKRHLSLLALSILLVTNAGAINPTPIGSRSLLTPAIKVAPKNPTRSPIVVKQLPLNPLNKKLLKAQLGSSIKAGNVILKKVPLGAVSPVKSTPTTSNTKNLAINVPQATKEEEVVKELQIKSLLEPQCIAPKKSPALLKPETSESLDSTPSGLNPLSPSTHFVTPQNISSEKKIKEKIADVFDLYDRRFSETRGTILDKIAGFTVGVSAMYLFSSWSSWSIFSLVPFAVGHWFLFPLADRCNAWLKKESLESYISIRNQEMLLEKQKAKNQGENVQFNFQFLQYGEILQIQKNIETMVAELLKDYDIKKTNDIDYIQLNEKIIMLYNSSIMPKLVKLRTEMENFSTQKKLMQYDLPHNYQAFINQLQKIKGINNQNNGPEDFLLGRAQNTDQREYDLGYEKLKQTYNRFIEHKPCIDELNKLLQKNNSKVIEQEIERIKKVYEL